MTLPLFVEVIQRYLRGEQSKAAAAVELRALGMPMIANVPEADAERVKDLYLHAAWLDERERDPSGAPAEPPTFGSMLEQLPPEERELLRRMGPL